MSSEAKSVELHPTSHDHEKDESTTTTAAVVEVIEGGEHHQEKGADKERSEEGISSPSGVKEYWGTQNEDIHVVAQSDKDTSLNVTEVQANATEEVTHQQQQVQPLVEKVVEIQPEVTEIQPEVTEIQPEVTEAKQSEVTAEVTVVPEVSDTTSLQLEVEEEPGVGVVGDVVEAVSQEEVFVTSEAADEKVVEVPQVTITKKEEDKPIQDLLREVVQEVENSGRVGLMTMDSNESLGSSKGSEDAEANSLEDSSPSGVPEIELIIKASTIDGRRKGACIFCQEYFMDLYLLAEIKAISLKITTVDMKRPPVDFRSNFEAAQPPILIDNMHAILENEKIERHIMKHIPGGHNLFVADPGVEKRLENLYNRFKIALVRQDDSSRRSVVAILRLINETLEEKGTRFLTGDTLCCFDCELMPKLQHIRVAGRFFLDGFDIPSDLVHLWKYIREMYELDAFVQSCPADQDIIHVYKMQRMNTLTRRQTKTREELEAPTYLTSIPDNVVI